MAKKASKNKLNFSHSKYRMIVLILATIVIVGIVLIWANHRAKMIGQVPSAAKVRAAPGLDTVPGQAGSSRNYIKQVEKRNVEQAQQAARTGGSALPTLTRETYTQQPLTSVIGSSKPACQPQSLERARAAGVTASELRCKGCTVAELKAVGFTAGELRRAGFDASDLRAAGFTAAQLKAAGFSAVELKAAGYTPADLITAGYTPAELKAVGFSATALKNAGVSASDLLAAGFSGQELSGAGYGEDQLQSADKAADASQSVNCSVDRIRLERQQGVSASQIRSTSNCSLQALKAAGYSAADLKNAGFTASQLKNAGFTAKQLKDAGFAAGQLLNAGYSRSDLAKAGFTPGQIAAGEAALAQMKDQTTACSIAKLKQERLNNVTASQIHSESNCSIATLKAAGFSAADLKNAGFSAAALKAAGFSAIDLKNAGFSAAALKAAGFTAADLKNSGFSASDLKNAGFSAADLKAAGYTARALNNAGFSAGELMKDGFTPNQLAAAGYDGQALRHAGVTPDESKAAGVSAVQLKRAGLTCGDLTRAGYSNSQLMQAGCATASQGSDQTAMTGAPTQQQLGRFAIAPTGESKQAADLKRLQQQQDQQMSLQQRQQAAQQIQAAMQTQANQLFANWSPPATQAYQQAAVTTVSNNAATGGGTTAKNGNGSTGSAVAQGGVTGNTLKAGDIVFGVLNTSVNSDEQSPIMATVVQGKYKGGKLVGQFNRVNKRVVMQFNQLNLPWLNKSISVNIVAIDPNTARTALATDVNSHYMLRYGTLFGSAFLEGLSEAVQGQGTTNITNGSTIITSKDKLNTGEKVSVALGKVGQAYSDKMGQNFQTPPTVKVASGTGIGLLIMQDVTIPGHEKVKSNS